MVNAYPTEAFVEHTDEFPRRFFSALYRGVCDARRAERLSDYMDVDSAAIAQALNAVTRSKFALPASPDAEMPASVLNETPLFNNTLLRFDPIRGCAHAKEPALLVRAKRAVSIDTVFPALPSPL